MKRRNFLKLICASPLCLLMWPEEQALPVQTKIGDAWFGMAGNMMFYGNDKGVVFCETDKSCPRKTYFKIVGRTNSHLKIQKIRG